MQITEEVKKEAEKRLEKGMNYCENCETETVENISDACIKHKKMYSRIEKNN